MHLSQLCQRDILTVSAEAPVRKAAEMMRVHHVGALALTDPEDPTRVVGVVTDRDLVINLLAQDRLPQEQNVGAFSTPHLIRVPGTASVHEAVQAPAQARQHAHGQVAVALQQARVGLGRDAEVAVRAARQLRQLARVQRLAGLAHGAEQQAHDLAFEGAMAGWQWLRLDLGQVYVGGK